MKFLSTIFYMLSLLSITSLQAQTHNLLIGTYTKPGGSEGIYVYEFDAKSGKAKLKNSARGIENPSYLALNKKGTQVYAVNETNTGEVTAFNFNKQTGELEKLNQQPSGGAHPCYISIDDKEKHVFAANYTGGSISVLPVNKDGSLGSALQTFKFIPNGQGKGRQEKPHAHATVLSPDEKYLFVNDLGNDEILAYRYSHEAEKPLVQSGSVTLPKGSGPRHLTFHPNKRWAYSLQELSAEVAAFSYQDGKLTPLQTISALAPGFKGRIWAADIHISPDGKFLYSSIRDDANEIAIFAIDKNGNLKLIGRQSTLGKTPRNFALDPSGNFLLVAHQQTNDVKIFKRDKKSGLLNYTGDSIQIDAPVCLKFAEAK